MAQEYTNPFEQDQVQNPNNLGAGGIAPGTPAPTTNKPPAAPPPTQNAFDLEKFRKSWYGKGDVNNVQGWLDSNRSFTDGVSLVNGHKAYRNGQFIADLVGNAHNPNQAKSAIFLDGIGSNGKPRTVVDPKKTGAVKPGGPTRTSAPSVSPTGAPIAAPAAPAKSIAPVRDPRLDTLYNTLMDRANQGTKIDRNDPVIRAQADAYSANQERSRRNYLGDLAEKSGPNANLRGEARLSAERVGQATGDFESELMGRELSARRQEISEALNSAGNLLTEEQRLALTNKLHLLDDQTRRLGLNQQNSQFYANLNQDDRHFTQDLGYRNNALAQSDNQFRDRLGFDYADRSNYWDSLYRGLV